MKLTGIILAITAVYILAAHILPEVILRLRGVRCDAGEEAAWINDLEMELTR